MSVIGICDPLVKGWGETTRTLVPWRQGFRHPTRNECMGWFAQSKWKRRTKINIEEFVDCLVKKLVPKMKHGLLTSNLPLNESS